MQFDFDQQLTPQNSIEIDDVGNIGLEAWTEDGYYFYLFIKSIMGTSVISQCGPIIPDLDALPSDFKITLEKVPSRPDKLIKTIKSFLNSGKNPIKQALVYEPDEVIGMFRDVKEYLSTLSEDSI